MVDAPLGQALSVSGSQFVTAHINCPASARTLWRVVSWATPGAGPQNVIIFEHCRSSRRSHGGGKVTARGFQGTRADARPGQGRTAAGPPRRPPSQAPPAPGADRRGSRGPGDRGRRVLRRRRLERVVRHEQGEEHRGRLDDHVCLGAQFGGGVGECEPDKRRDAADVGVPTTGTDKMTIATSAGTVTASLDRQAAPCTVANFDYLAEPELLRQHDMQPGDRRRTARSSALRRPDRRTIRTADRATRTTTRTRRSASPRRPARARIRARAPVPRRARSSTPPARSPCGTRSPTRTAASSSSFTRKIPRCRRTTRSSARSPAVSTWLARSVRGRQGRQPRRHADDAGHYHDADRRSGRGEPISRAERVRRGTGTPEPSPSSSQS